MRSLDEQLLDCIADGDASAFADFFDRHAPRVLGFLVRMVGNHADAEDLLQETFWQVWRNAGNYDPQRAAVLVWLYTIARSRAVDLLRRNRKTRRDTTTEQLPQLVDPVQVSGHALLRFELHGALTCIPPEQQTAIVLSFFLGWTHVEIAERENIPLGTVKTRIALGMRRLRELLKSWQEEH